MKWNEVFQFQKVHAILMLLHTPCLLKFSAWEHSHMFFSIENRMNILTDTSNSERVLPTEKHPILSFNMHKIPKFITSSYCWSHFLCSLQGFYKPICSVSNSTKFLMVWHTYNFICNICRVDQALCRGYCSQTFKFPRFNFQLWSINSIVTRAYAKTKHQQWLYQESPMKK